MLHIILAQGWRLGADTHGSTFTPASGQVLVAFQLLANSNTLFTTNPPWVVKSFFPSPLKSPHRPQTFPCQQGSATLMMPTSTAVPSPQSLNCREVSVTPGTHAMLRLQEDSDGCFTIPHHCQADRGINHQVHADCPYFVVNQRAVSKVLFLIFTLQQFHFRSLISKKFSWFFFFFCRVQKTETCRLVHDTSFALTPSWTLTVLEHVVPVDPHGTFSVITPKGFSTVLLSHLFLKEK